MSEDDKEYQADIALIVFLIGDKVVRNVDLEKEFVDAVTKYGSSVKALAALKRKRR
jgi:hypothetical protein